MFCNSVNITPESLILTDFPCRMEILGFEENHSLLVIFLIFFRKLICIIYIHLKIYMMNSKVLWIVFLLFNCLYSCFINCIILYFIPHIIDLFKDWKKLRTSDTCIQLNVYYITHIFIWLSQLPKVWLCNMVWNLKAQQDASWSWSTMKKDVCLYKWPIITWEVENMVYRSRIFRENVELHKLHAVINMPSSQ